MPMLFSRITRREGRPYRLFKLLVSGPKLIE